MNNLDLRSVIFSFLGSKYCTECKKWINNNKYISFSSEILCMLCFKIK